jgi:hypothetical protein
MKSILKSRTFWLAVIQGVVGVLVVIQSSAPELDSFGYLAVLKSVLDVLLRMDTDTPVGITG